jgi:lipopolysaccharide/colanic/teichoic acid biosynthesis glycosyltransferase
MGRSLEVGLLRSERCNAERTYARRVKPVMDRALAALLLLVLAPAIAVVAAAVRARMGAPVLYRQTRVGRGGAPFTLLKFRTMTADRRVAAVRYDGVERRVSFEAGDDPRHTPLGDLLRRWILDELPQIWNVLRGDMSLVGPRPEVPPAVATYPEHAAERHVVRPGLTGLWQVTARGTEPMEAGVAVDIEYVRRVSFALDCRILALTPAAVIGAGRNPPPFHRTGAAAARHPRRGG